MILLLKLIIFLYSVSFTQAHTHDDISKCFLTGVHKTRQTIISSPNYPDNYKADICWDYVIRSPFKCPTKFHIQFLEFDLEFSEGCKNDYLAVGLDNIDDDMDVLCGRVVGIKKYHTPDGILRLRFFADNSPWTTGKGFKLLITRLACEREELLRKLKDEEDDVGNDDDSIAVTATSDFFQPPEIFRNLTGQEQYQSAPVPPIYGLNYLTQLPSPPYPATGTVFLPSTANQRPLLFSPGGNERRNQFPLLCANDNEQQRQLSNVAGYYGGLQVNSLDENVQAGYVPLQLSNNANKGGFVLPSRDQYIGTPSLRRTYDNAIDALETCCVSAFQQKRFYLSSPGFPRTIFSSILPDTSKRDCVFRLQKSASNICRLRVDLKFFDFGQNYQGTGSFSGNIGIPAIESTQDICKEDFIEIDSQRFCGCRSGSTFTSYWPTAADKKLRMRMGYSGVPSGGFLLEIVQEACSETQLAAVTTETPLNFAFSTPSPNRIDAQLADPHQNPQIIFGQQYPYGNLYPIQQAPLLQTQNNPYISTSQTIFNRPVGFPTYLQQPNLLPNQQKKEPPFLQNSDHYPSPFGSNYFSAHDLQQNLLQAPVYNTNPYGLLQIRYARSYADQQPVTIVETNSTRKEFHYAEKEPTQYDQPPSFHTRPTSTERIRNWDRKDTNVKENINTVVTHGRERRKCSFNTGDILRLSVDILWITKPICYAPQRNWFTNWIG